MATLWNEFYWISSGSVGTAVEFFTHWFFVQAQIYSPSLNSWLALFRFVVCLVAHKIVSWILLQLQCSRRRLLLLSCGANDQHVSVTSWRSTRRLWEEAEGTYILLHTVIIFSYSYWGFQFLTCLGPNIIIFRCPILITLTDQSSQIKNRLKFITVYTAWTIFLLIWEATTEAFSFKCKCISWLGYLLWGMEGEYFLRRDCFVE